MADSFNTPSTPSAAAARPRVLVGNTSSPFCIAVFRFSCVNHQVIALPSTKKTAPAPHPLRLPLCLLRFILVLLLHLLYLCLEILMCAPIGHGITSNAMDLASTPSDPSTAARSQGFVGNISSTFATVAPLYTYMCTSGPSYP